ncbi:MAG: response regulator [Calditrichaeota bacterium]|nr:MAG: response regulator [Calditrichota bacterium]
MGQQKTVLLVDDEQIMHDLARAYLEREGFTLQSAYTGVSGLETIKDLRPDIVLLDYMLPRMDGEQVFSELRQNPAYEEVRDTPVILLTARGSDDSLKTRLLKQGIVAYLQKPFGLRELSDVINNIITLRDIRHSHRLLEIEVKSTKQHLSSIFHNAPVGIFSCNSHGELLQVNQYLLQILPELSYENQFINVLHNEFFKDSFFTTGVRYVLETGQSWKKELIPWASGQMKKLILNVHFVPIQVEKDDREDSKSVMGIIEDVTEWERKNFQLKLLSQVSSAMQQTMGLRKLLHLLLTAITAGPALSFTRAMIFMVDETESELKGAMGVGPMSSEDAMQIWNRLNRENLNMEQYLFNYGPTLPGENEKLNLHVLAIAIPLNAKTELTKVLQEKRSFRYKIDNQAGKNDAAFPACLNPLQLEDFIAMPVVANDRLLGVIIADNKFGNQPILEDRIHLLSLIASQAAHGIEKAHSYEQLHEEKQKLEQAYDELHRAQEKLVHAEKLAAIGEMAAHVAHEIRNPLVTIGGFASQLQKKTNFENNETNPAQIIADEVLRLEKILENVLNFTKLPDPEPSINNINKLIEDVVEQIKPVLENSEITIQTNLQSNCPDQYFDQGQLKQVLINLLQNSQQSFEKPGIIRITSFLENEIVLIRIEDNGPGIASDMLTDIFNPFYTTKKHGTGLGLAISQRIVHGHGGEIRVKTKLGQGTRFDILLPVNFGSGTQENKNSVVNAVIV